MLAMALEEGLTEIYRKQIASAYLAGKIDRDEAITRLTEEFIRELDYAQEAVSHDINWGLNGD